MLKRSDGAAARTLVTEISASQLDRGHRRVMEPRLRDSYTLKICGYCAGQVEDSDAYGYRCVENRCHHKRGWRPVFGELVTDAMDRAAMRAEMERAHAEIEKKHAEYEAEEARRQAEWDAFWSALTPEEKREWQERRRAAWRTALEAYGAAVSQAVAAPSRLGQVLAAGDPYKSPEGSE